ncbi:MAG: heavy-metal-associated domain-containing protein [Ferruginibacter sp.]
MKLYFLVIATFFVLAAKPQVAGVSLKASGLTCSMCSNAIYKALKTLDFIDAVEADISTYTFAITFKPGTDVDFDKIKKKVETAGFSVAGFVATVSFNKVLVDQSGVLNVGNMSFYILNEKPAKLEGTRQIRILNKGFVSLKEYKQYHIPRELPAANTFYIII